MCMPQKKQIRIVTFNWIVQTANLWVLERIAYQCSNVPLALGNLRTSPKHPNSGQFIVQSYYRKVRFRILVDQLTLVQYPSEYPISETWTIDFSDTFYAVFKWSDHMIRRTIQILDIGLYSRHLNICFSPVTCK